MRRTDLHVSCLSLHHQLLIFGGDRRMNRVSMFVPGFCSPQPLPPRVSSAVDPRLFPLTTLLLLPLQARMRRRSNSGSHCRTRVKCHSHCDRWRFGRNISFREREVVFALFALHQQYTHIRKVDQQYTPFICVFEHFAYPIF